MKEPLQKVREKVDALDDKIHTLLMQRAELIREVSAIKRGSGRPIVHPAREASMIRRLLGRHKGILPQATVIGIWRELVGGVSMLQRGLHAYVSTEGGQTYCWDMAKDYCGSVIPMTRVDDTLSVIAYARDNQDAFAVVPWPEDGPLDTDTLPWWMALARLIEERSETAAVRIVAALPFGQSTPFATVKNRALALSRMEFLPSGDDNSFIALTCPSEISRSRLISLLSRYEMEALSLSVNTEAGKVGAYLIEVKGYIAADDPRLHDIQAALDVPNSRMLSLGGYPVPPALRSGDTDPIEL